MYNYCRGRVRSPWRGALAFILNIGGREREGRCLRLSKTEEGGREGGDRCPRQKRICHFGIDVVAGAVGIGAAAPAVSSRKKQTDSIEEEEEDRLIELASRGSRSPSKRNSSLVCPRFRPGRARASERSQQFGQPFRPLFRLCHSVLFDREAAVAARRCSSRFMAWAPPRPPAVRRRPRPIKAAFGAFSFLHIYAVPFPPALVSSSHVRSRLALLG